MPSTKRLVRRTVLLWILIIVVGLAAVAAIGFDVMRRASTMRASTTGVASVLALRPGEHVRVVVRLGALVAANVRDAEILESRDGANYHATRSHVRIALNADTAIVMGGVADIRPGALVQIAGESDAEHVLHASQIAILNGFVRMN